MVIGGELLDMTVRLGAALAAGGLIGIERSYHGRPAGFRTHTLVCLASALLMLVTVYESQWFTQAGNSRVVVDPTRMAQGIMTGIGFLGAGVIMREGLSVRGLTTAASIWVTAAIGILFGIGFYIPAMMAVAATLFTLSSFRWIESRMPTEFYAQFHIKFRRASVMTEADLRAITRETGFSIANMTFELTDGGQSFEYRMGIKTLKSRNMLALSERLKQEASVVEFRITPIGA
ncbi:MAG: MgtC/SapB family protein [Burkholderiales bacterium]|nr:MgtC/SapB family protein [Burkholderiales bacterium]